MLYTTNRPSRQPLQIHPEEPTPSLLAKDCKDTSELTTYLSYFSVTYSATSLKLAKFSITERVAGVPEKTHDCMTLKASFEEWS